ncbi:MinD/ParA family protein [Paenibacillus sp. y28]|uniref:MinD/ParA family protein n=1 Tax=Paenibacillus sp. y28 TaxID=3129110 RepID=UPI00301A9F09
MSDQAQMLRNLVQSQASRQEKQTRVITVTSGKGGVGKSNFSLNFALMLQSKGYKVLLFDADVGMANIDVLMGSSPKYSLYHLLKREQSIWDIIHTGYNNLQFIAGGSGFNDLLNLDDTEIDYFVEQVGQLNGHVDFILFDTGAGLSKEAFRFIVAAQETVVVTTPEPTSITDAYALIKMVHSMNGQTPFKLVVNRVTDLKEGRQTADKISMVARQFLGLELPLLGYIDEDIHVSKAVKKQIPFTVLYPSCAATRAVHGIMERFLSGQLESGEQAGGVKSFLNKMMKLLK